MLGLIGWIVQLVDPTSIDWVNVTFVLDMVFVVAFAGFMVWARRDTVRTSEATDAKNITAQDYSIQVDGVPANATAEDLAGYFSQVRTISSSSSSSSVCPHLLPSSVCPQTHRGPRRLLLPVRTSPRGQEHRR